MVSYVGDRLEKEVEVGNFTLHVHAAGLLRSE